MKYLRMGWLKKIEKELVFESVLFWTGVGSAALFFENNFLLTAIFVILCGIRMALYHKKDDIFFFVSGAFLGPLSEAILVQFGVWQYANPTLFGIPIWLPLAWGLAIMMIKRLAEVFLEIKIK